MKFSLRDLFLVDRSRGPAVGRWLDRSKLANRLEQATPEERTRAVLRDELPFAVVRVVRPTRIWRTLPNSSAPASNPSKR